MTDWNIGVDDDGDEYALGPGDEYYRAYEPVEAIELAGLDGVVIVGTDDLGDGSTLTSYEVAAVVDDRVVIVGTSYFDGDATEVSELLPQLLAGLTIGG